MKTVQNEASVQHWGETDGFKVPNGSQYQFSTGQSGTVTEVDVP